jgi:hypothetical protein
VRMEDRRSLVPAPSFRCGPDEVLADSAATRFEATAVVLATTQWVVYCTNRRRRRRRRGRRRGRGRERRRGR